MKISCKIMKKFCDNTLTPEGIVKGNDSFLFGNKVKAYLRRGARALPGFLETPNYRIGYGTLCVEASFPGKS